MSDQFEATRALVRAVRGIRWEEIPDGAREVARHCLLDFLGVAIAGSREPLTEILVKEIVRGERSDEASLIGRTRARNAANRGAGQRRGGSRARFRRHTHGDGWASVGPDHSGNPRARGNYRCEWSRCARRDRRRRRDRMPTRRADRRATLCGRISFDRHARNLRRRGRMRAHAHAR